MCKKNDCFSKKKVGGLMNFNLGQLENTSNLIKFATLLKFTYCKEIILTLDCSVLC